MRDQRLQVFRKAIETLTESLEAVVRLSRWTGPEAKPEALVSAANKLQERLGAADRLAASHFNGPTADVAKVTAMRAAMKKLDAAYLAYMQQSSNAADRKAAADALESEIAATTTDAEAWR
jgi:uncharacterized protein (DUF1800 family)